MLIDTAFYRGTVMAQVLNDYKNKKNKKIKIAVTHGVICYGY